MHTIIIRHGQQTLSSVVLSGCGLHQTDAATDCKRRPPEHYVRTEVSRFEKVTECVLFFFKKYIHTPTLVSQTCAAEGQDRPGQRARAGELSECKRTRIRRSRPRRTVRSGCHVHVPASRYILSLLGQSILQRPLQPRHVPAILHRNCLQHHHHCHC